MATEYKLSYTASDIDRRLGKVDEIDSLKNLVGTTPVADQISESLLNSQADWNQTDNAAADYIKNKPTIPSIEGLATTTYVDEQIASVGGTGSDIEIDTTLSEEGKAADAKAAGDAIVSVAELANEAKEEAYSKVPQTRTINGKTLEEDIVLTAEDVGAVTEAEVDDKIAEAIVEVYVQDEEPTEAVAGDIWVDTDADGASTASNDKTARIYLEDARTTDMSQIDFSKYTVGDIIVVTVS